MTVTNNFDACYRWLHANRDTQESNTQIYQLFCGIALVALSATGQSNISFPAPSNYLQHADFILLETANILTFKCPKELNICWAFCPLLHQPAVTGAAWPRLRSPMAVRLQALQFPARKRMKPWFHPALEYFIPSGQIYHFLNSSALQFSTQSLLCSGYLGSGNEGRSYLKEKASNMQ